MNAEFIKFAALFTWMLLIGVIIQSWMEHHVKTRTDSRNERKRKNT